MFADVAARLIQLGCREISLGDTIGIATPEQTCEIINCVAEQVPIEQLAVHMHNTYDRAIDNIEAALALGIRVVDSSVAGLGGCPYASDDGKGAPGNVATEAVVALLNRLGYSCGVDLQKLLTVGGNIAQQLYTQEP